MTEEYLIQHCAPTLAGIKTGSLFTCPYICREAFLTAVRRMNRQLQGKGLRILPLRWSDSKALIYVYRPKKLTCDIADTDAARILRRQGYDTSTCEKCVHCLARRLRYQEDFPHEIGLFLGYPPQDVRGFMENRACKCTGCWKVYGDEETARKKFAQYKKCSRVYREQWARGIDIERLTVAG